MSDVILRLSAMHFEDRADLDLVDGELIEGDLDGATALPLVAYEMMLPLLDGSDDDVLPVLFAIDHADDAARRIVA